MRPQQQQRRRVGRFRRVYLNVPDSKAPVARALFCETDQDGHWYADGFSAELDRAITEFGVSVETEPQAADRVAKTNAGLGPEARRQLQDYARNNRA